MQNSDNSCSRLSEFFSFLSTVIIIIVIIIHIWFCLFIYYPVMVSKEHLFWAQSQNDKTRMQMCI